MRLRKSVFTGLLIGGLIASPFSFAEIKSKSDSYKALALQAGGFNVATIQKLIEKGDVLNQRPGIKHREIACSKDFEVLEIVSPANFETRIVDGPDSAKAAE